MTAAILIFLASKGRETLFLDDPWLTLLGALIIIALIYVELTMHEFGHWIFARIFRQRVLGFSVGQGRVLFKKRDPVNCQFFQFRLWPIGGYVIPLTWSGTESRTASFLISAGGPLFSGLFCGTMALAYVHLDFAVLSHPWSIVLRQITAIMIVLSFIDLAYNVIPHSFRMGSALVSNDGQSMLYTLVASNFPRANYHRHALKETSLPTGRQSDAAVALEVDESAEGKEYHLKHLYHSYLDEFDESVKILDEALESPSLTTAERVFFLGEYARLVLDARQKKILRRASEALEEALTLFPSSELLLVKSAVLKIIDRFYNDGRRILEDLLDTTSSVHIRACCECGLAIADARQNDLPSGKQHLAAAQNIDRSADLYELAYSAVMVAPHVSQAQETA